MNNGSAIVPRLAEFPQDIVNGLAELERALIARHDRGAVFATAYLASARMVDHWGEWGLFARHDEVARLSVAFVNAYLRALQAHEERRFDDVPNVWRMAFDAASDAHVSVAQLLLLGINAHINHDLPIAVVQCAIDVHCHECHHDFTRVNDALRMATPLVRHRVAGLYGWPLRVISAFCGRTIDDAVSVTFERARQNSWVLAKALDAAPSPAERWRVRALIDERATSTGRLILRRRYAPSASLASLYAMEPSLS
jgi:hypothetical protein